MRPALDDGGLASGRAARGAFEPARVPRRQIPQVPQPEVMVDTPGALLGEHLPHETQLESLTGQRRAENVLLGAIEQPRAQHVRRRAAEPALAAVYELAVEASSLGDALEHPLRNPVAVLHVRRNCQGELDEFVVEIR